MNLKNGWVLRVDDDVWKYLDRIPRNDTKRIVAEMDKLTENPFGDDSKKMRGEDALWRRLGGFLSNSLSNRDGRKNRLDTPCRAKDIKYVLIRTHLKGALRAAKEKTRRRGSGRLSGEIKFSFV